MKTLSQLVELLRLHYNEMVEIKYFHPSLYLVCVDESFATLGADKRIAKVCATLQVSEEELAAITSHGIAQLVLVTPDERENEYSFLESKPHGQHWISWYGRLSDKKNPASIPLPANSPGIARALHFYGFKGGQARSTVLVLLAKSLADQGARVLIVDADVEAPSLDAFFDVATDDPGSTLMGLCGWATHVSPIPRVYVGQPNSGTIDLIACRPRHDIYDMDFAGFLLSTTFDATVLQTAAQSLRAYAYEPNTPNARYDFVMFDHRTGLSPSVLPIMEGWPGPAIIFIRPDGMSHHVESSGIFKALLAYDSESPGTFVSFSLDPKDTTESVFEKHGKFVEGLLEQLSDAINSFGDAESLAIDPSELERYWILWHHDPSILSKTAPPPNQLSSSNQASLNQIQEVLGLRLQEPFTETTSAPLLTKSGSTDEGIFILTPDVARLFSLESKFLYIFGRKGTGKTRLLRELNLQGLGEPLLVAQDFLGGGIQSGGSVFNELLRACGSNFETFWWALLHSALDAAPVGENIQTIAANTAKKPADELLSYGSSNAVEKKFTTASAVVRRVFLIDGVETAVPAAKLREFVESLFRFLATAQYNRTIASNLTIRLFLRSDLYKSAAQNVEQQIEGSVMHLRWDRTSILNFAVARIASLDWFKTTFSSVAKKVNEKISTIAKGGLSDSGAEELLLEIFPKRLERNKLKTTTFFATYFSDAGGDSEAKASFYPRLFDGFLRQMNDVAKTNPDRAALKDDRLNSPFVLTAYDAASSVFIDEVRTELHNLLDLVPGDAQNKDAVNKLIEAFSGLSTPFELEAIIAELERRSQISTNKIRDALGRMKDLGIFEDRPGYPGQWRTGRLYKSGLKMKYVRAQNTS